ncbi:MAG: DUF664 domain-containing protein [Nocardioidaceae bacterium]|nr:DUF664 domain-containing protein [Nocardioidaceae bacterium]NUS50997.1 DUF664 domain-containing protein [Nocardioidaceae bacterium]
MATATDVLLDGYDRVRETVASVVSGLDEDALTFRPDPAANSIAWLVWHLTRVQDDHVADVAGSEQVWTVGGWVERFRLPLDVAATGYGMSAEEVGLVRAPAELLAAYHEAVHNATVDYLKTLQPDDYERIVDERWDPPVSLMVRLVSVLDDAAQHVGQASYLRGLVERR